MSTEEDLRSFVAGVSGFAEMGHADKVRLFAWLQHHLFKKDRFSTADINWCYDKLSFEPSNTSQYLKNLEKSGELLKDTNGYRSEGKFRADYDTKYGVHQVTLQVRDLVKNMFNDMPEFTDNYIYLKA